jgi:hypothetical protein
VKNCRRVRGGAISCALGPHLSYRRRFRADQLREARRRREAAALTFSRPDGPTIFRRVVGTGGTATDLLAELRRPKVVR